MTFFTIVSNIVDFTAWSVQFGCMEDATALRRSAFFSTAAALVLASRCGLCERAFFCEFDKIYISEYIEKEGNARTSGYLHC